MAVASPCPAPIPATVAKAAIAKPWIFYQEQIVKQVFIKNPKTVVMLVTSFPLHHQLDRGACSGDSHPGSCFAGRRHSARPVLFGDYNPGGHLVRTWPKSADQLPPRMDYNIRDGYTYMYFKGEPLYPFGFGLSYTTFKFATSAPVPRTARERRLRDGDR